MKRFEETLKDLNDAAKTSDSILVAYSGGKDSVVVLDLAMRTFKHVECFFLYLIPGLECVEIALAEASAKYGIKIHQYPHFIIRWYLTEGAFCPNHWSMDDLPEWKMRDVYQLAMVDTNIPLIATGAKKTDSLTRRKRVGTTMTDTLTPIKSWTKVDVLAYLKSRGIPLPDSSQRATTGIDLSIPNLLWLHDSWPKDFARLCEVFPYAESVVWRRKWYGIP